MPTLKFLDLGTEALYEFRLLFPRIKLWTPRWVGFVKIFRHLLESRRNRSLCCRCAWNLTELPNRLLLTGKFLASQRLQLRRRACTRLLLTGNLRENGTPSLRRSVNLSNLRLKVNRSTSKKSHFYFLRRPSQYETVAHSAPSVSHKMSFCASQTSPCEPRNAAPASPPSIAA